MFPLPIENDNSKTRCQRNYERSKGGVTNYRLQLKRLARALTEKSHQFEKLQRLANCDAYQRQATGSTSIVQ